MTSDHRAKPDPATPVSEAANIGVARPPLLYSGSIALGVMLHSAWPISLLPRSVSPRFGAPVVPREERYLEARFPSEYFPYKASVRRWL